MTGVSVTGCLGNCGVWITTPDMNGRPNKIFLSFIELRSMLGELHLKLPSILSKGYDAALSRANGASEELSVLASLRQEFMDTPSEK